jgi:hypothetical protein
MMDLSSSDGPYPDDHDPHPPDKCDAGDVSWDSPEWHGTTPSLEQLKQLLEGLTCPEEQQAQVEELKQQIAKLAKWKESDHAGDQDGLPPVADGSPHWPEEADEDVSDPYPPDEPAHGAGTLAASTGLNGSAAPSASSVFADPELINTVPELAVQEWEIVRLGRRPRDFAARDFLVGSLLRDERPKALHWMWRKPRSWMTDAVSHLTDRDYKQGLQILTLHLLWRQHLARLLAKTSPDDEKVYRILRRLWRCWPYGSTVRWVGPGTRESRDVCGLHWLCPWCLCRKVMGLYDRLLAGPLAKADLAGKYLVTARVEILHKDIRHLDDDRDRARWCYDEVGRALRAYARYMLDVESGVVCYQAGPWLANWDHTLRSEVSLLGLSDLSAGYIEKMCSYYTPLFQGDPRLKTDLDTEWRAAPAAAPQALRLLLLGSSIDYKGQVQVTRSKSSRKDYGVRGALNVPPTFMFGDLQWWAYARAVYGLRFYRPFGGWAGALGPARRPKPELIATEADVAAWRRRRILEKANAARKDAAGARRQGLLALARPPWKEVRAAQQSRRGRPSLREPLRALLAAQGVDVGASDLDWLVTTLGQEERSAGQQPQTPATSA